MTETIPIRVQHKRMSSSEWEESSIILLDGEIGIETNTGKAKVGNGTNRYRDLKYIAGEKGEPGDTGQPGTPGTFQALSEQEKASLKGDRGEKGKDAIVGDYNLILNSLFPNTNIRTSGNPTLAIIPSDYNGRNALDVKKSGAASNTWAGVQIDTSQRMLRAGDKLVLRLPIYIYSDVNLDSGLYLAIKKHIGNKTLNSITLSDLPRNKWTIYEEKITITETIDFGNETYWFFLYMVKNGHFKIAEPYISYGEEVPPKWQPNLDDLKGNNIANQQNGQTLKYWVGTETQYNALSFKDNDTIYDIVR
jgi:hypothetical protein